MSERYQFSNAHAKRIRKTFMQLFQK
uniref:Uncharacterized protein n=1 Tax=Anguilla anguilla TaxID=7936 RepID=A0A0E9UXH1_ANGAN